VTEIFEVIALVTLNVTIAAIVFLVLYPWALGHFDQTAVRLVIRSKTMTDVVEGATVNFTADLVNKAGRVVSVRPAGVTVAVDANGTATVADDGTAGVFTAGATDGPANVVATSATPAFTSAPLTLNVTADNTPVALVITPA
jgi:hypothetical protein